MSTPQKPDKSVDPSQPSQQPPPDRVQPSYREPKSGESKPPQSPQSPPPSPSREPSRERHDSDRDRS